MNRPMISIIMPVYNASLFLREAIDSILEQTYTDFELIIINDGSTDNSEDIIGYYTDNRIVYLRNKTNLKLIESLNKGLRHAKGKYIARMDSDDMALPNRLALQVEYMEKHCDVVLCGSQIEYIDENGVLLQNSPVYPIEGADLISYSLFKSPIAHPAAMMRRNVLVVHNIYYDADYPHAEDVRLWFELMKYGRVVNLSQKLLKYRISEGQVTNRHREQQKISAFNARNEFVIQLIEGLGGTSKSGEITSVNINSIFSKSYSVELSTFVLSLKSKINNFTRFRLLFHVVSSGKYFYAKLALAKTVYFFLRL